MKIESKLLANGQWIVRKELADDYDQNSLLTEETIVIRGECLEMIKSYQLSTKGFLLLDTQMFFSQPETDRFEISEDCIVMDFMYGGNVEANIHEMNDPQYTTENTHNIWYSPNFRATYHMPAFKQVSYLCIVMSKDFYFNMISAGPELHHEFSRNIDLKKPDYLAAHYLPFSPAIQWVIHEIRNCQRKGAIKRMYIETKVRELLLLQLEMLTGEEAAVKTPMEETDFSKLQEARTILDAEYINAPTLAELSRKVSLNEFKLKKGFKACFGNTVKGYIIKLRMEYAKELFKSKPTSVSEVAYECGYKDVSHFSAAFKSFYGCSPQKFKIARNIINTLFYGFFLVGV